MLTDGDLVPVRRDLAMVTGTAKVQQDLRGALLEPLGNDRFHPGWGSSLDDFIAQIASESTRMEVESEVNRVISNYAAIQRDRIEADITSGGDTRFSTNEILARVRGVDVKIMDETVRVNISLQTVAGEIVVLTEAVT
jgi:phage baseplate assembly protein W